MSQESENPDPAQFDRSAEPDKPGESDQSAPADRPADSDKPAEPDDDLASRIRALLEGRRCVKFTRDDAAARRAHAKQDAFTLTALGRQLGVGRESLARLLAGLPLQHGTRLIIERNLRLWQGEGK